MKRLIILSFAGAFLMTLSSLDLAWGKAHVLLNRIQICNANGIARNIHVNGLQPNLNRGGCRLSACDFANVVFLGAACDTTDANDDGFCDEPSNTVDSAIGLTANCTAPPAP